MQKMKTLITKQLILGTIISFGLLTAASAQTAYDDQGYNDQSSNSQSQQYNQQPQQPEQYQQAAPVANGQQFEYYPDANVYYDPSCGRYDYYNGNAWLSVNVLPSNIYLGARYAVYHRGPQVWLDNAIHIRNYRGAYRQSAFAYNNNVRRTDFRRDVVRRDDFRGGNNFRGNNFRGNANGGRFENSRGRGGHRF
jgi:hypothetical protein